MGYNYDKDFNPGVKAVPAPTYTVPQRITVAPKEEEQDSYSRQKKQSFEPTRYNAPTQPQQPQQSFWQMLSAVLGNNFQQQAQARQANTPTGYQRMMGATPTVVPIKPQRGSNTMWGYGGYQSMPGLGGASLSYQTVPVSQSYLPATPQYEQERRTAQGFYIPEFMRKAQERRRIPNIPNRVPPQPGSVYDMLLNMPINTTNNGPIDRVQRMPKVEWFEQNGRVPEDLEPPNTGNPYGYYRYPYYGYGGGYGGGGYGYSPYGGGGYGSQAWLQGLMNWNI